MARTNFRKRGFRVADNTQSQQMISHLLDNISRVIVGKPAAIQQCVIALLCNGHALIEDVPGVGKTMLAKSLARSTACLFKRIQFTPDLLPSDVTGVTVYNQKTAGFEYHAGPVVSQILLADEINRATPKAQSALLEAMEEHQITVDGVTRPLPEPFLSSAVLPTICQHQELARPVWLRRQLSQRAFSIHHPVRDNQYQLASENDLVAPQAMDRFLLAQ